jgi:hypothetical protein
MTRSAPRASVAALVALVVIVLPVAWFVDLVALYTSSFPVGGPNLGRVGVLVVFLAAAVVGLGVPAAVAVTEARARRHDRTRSRAACVASFVALVLAVPMLVLPAASKSREHVELESRKSQPPTALERRTEDRDVRAELTELGDDTVRALGGDPDARTSFGERAGSVRRYDCRLENLGPGVEWAYRYDVRSLEGPDGAPLVAEGEQLPSATGDLEAVTELWAGRGIEAVSEGERAGELRAEADWLQDYPTIYRGPGVSLVTACFVDV